MVDKGDAQRPPATQSEAPTLYMGDRGPAPFAKVKTLGEGITTAGAEQVIHLPKREYYPVGLGEWVRQQSDLETEFPPTPGSWVKNPNDKDMKFLVVKESRTNNIERGALSQERAALLQLNSLFPQDAVARPPVLHGYGVRKSTGNPYLVLENLSKELPPYDKDFESLDKCFPLPISEVGPWNSGNTRPIPEAEALDIAERIGFVLKIAHANDIAHNDVHNLENIFWDRQRKFLRLIDWGNSAFPERTRRFMNNFSFKPDRQALARVLFQLVTGHPVPTRGLKGNISREDWAKMSQPTRDIIAKGLYLRPREESYLSIDATDTTRMFRDIQSARQLLPKAAA